MIDRETAIALAKEAGFDFNKYGLLQADEEGEIDADAMFERLCNLAVAHSRKDAGPVAWIYTEKQGRVLSFTPPTNFDKQELSEGEIGIEALFTHPPEADKLLQQALEANDLVVKTYGLDRISLPARSATAIRTYLENKNA